MPYESKAQQGYFHAHRAELEKQGVNVNEWDQASRGKKLPMKKDGTDAITTPKAKSEGKPKEAHKAEHKGGAHPKGAELHSITTRKLHDGTFAHEHHYKDKNGLPHHMTHEYSSADINDVKEHMQEHMGGGAGEAAGAPGEGEEEATQGQPAAAAPPQASAAPPAAGGDEEEE
jgi:hypothetical protein